ncbi:MAG: CsbD family protein [Pseudomonadota bacterium]
MNKNTIEGNWNEFKGKVKEKWGQLTDDQLDVIDGKRDRLKGEIQQAYGVSRENAEKQVEEFETLNKH